LFEKTIDLFLGLLGLGSVVLVVAAAAQSRAFRSACASPIKTAC
jgi:hypothetical protein